MGKKDRKHKQSSAASKGSVAPENCMSDPKSNKILEELFLKCVLNQKKLDLEYHKELWELLRQLERAQGPSKLDRLPLREECLGGFLAWLDKGGLQREGVEVVKIPEKGWGLRATIPYQMNAHILEIHSKFMLIAASVKDGPLAKIQSAEILRIFQEMPHVLLALLLMNELSVEDSLWEPYIKFLPRTYTLPLYFTPEDMTYLTGSPSQGDCINQVRTIASLYCNFHRLLRSCDGIQDLPIISSGFKFKDFFWAVSTVMSRQNKIVINKEKKTLAPALIPLWDLCNHSHGQISTDFDPDKSVCVCYAQRDYASGDEITIFYGPRSNFDLLCYSGFVFTDNSFDYVLIRLGLSTSEKILCQKRKSLLEKIEIPCSGMFRVMKNQNHFVGETLAFVRIFVASAEELEMLSQRDGGELRTLLLNPMDCVSKDNEMKTYDFLSKRCSLLLRPYQTTIEEDSRLLSSKDGHLSEEARQAVLLRRCEKSILTVASADASKKVKALTE